MAAIPGELIKNELFGYEKGAFALACNTCYKLPLSFSFPLSSRPMPPFSAVVTSLLAPVFSTGVYIPASLFDLRNPALFLFPAL
jgi:hypothetical protein